VAHPVTGYLLVDLQIAELYSTVEPHILILFTYTMPPKAESSTAYREPAVQDDDDDDFDDLDGKSRS